MLVVAEASVLVQALTKFDEEGDRLRSWLVGLSDGQEIEVLRNTTKLEFLSLLRSLCERGDMSPALAEEAIRDFIALPARQRDITQPMAARIWELRNTVAVRDAAHVALVERLQAEEEAEVVLASLDSTLARLPNLAIPIKVFSEN